MISWRIAVALSASVVVLDQLSKYLIDRWIERGSTADLLPVIDLVNVRNEGVAFGLFAGKGLAVSVMATAVVLGFLLFAARVGSGSHLSWLSVALLLGGAVGNLIDRARIGSVIDFLDLPYWPPFNLADVAITLGAIGLAFALYRDSQTDVNR